MILQRYPELVKNLPVGLYYPLQEPEGSVLQRLDPYAMDQNGRRINVSEWKMHHRLLRLDNTNWNIGFSYTLSSDKAKSKNKTTKGTPQERKDINDFYDYYVDFDIPWSFSINYNFLL